MHDVFSFDDDCGLSEKVTSVDLGLCVSISYTLSVKFKWYAPEGKRPMIICVEVVNL